MSQNKAEETLKTTAIFTFIRCLYFGNTNNKCLEEKNITHPHTSKCSRKWWEVTNASRKSKGFSGEIKGFPGSRSFRLPLISRRAKGFQKGQVFPLDKAFPGYDCVSLMYVCWREGKEERIFALSLQRTYILFRYYLLAWTSCMLGHWHIVSTDSRHPLAFQISVK